jgi:hypothetical protein
MGLVRKEKEVLFHVTWEIVDSSEEGQRTSLATFAKWTPGPAQFLGFYSYVEGNGGFAIVEAASAGELARTMAPFTPWLAFEAKAILPVQEAATIGGEAIAWREANA